MQTQKNKIQRIIAKAYDFYKAHTVEGKLARIDQETKERIDEILGLSKEAMLRIDEASTKEISRSRNVVYRCYTLENAFKNGSSFLPGKAADFVKVTYNFSTDCDSDNGSSLEFNPRYADTHTLPAFIPRSVLPNVNLKTNRHNSWGRWDYANIDRKSIDFFVSKEDLTTSMGSLKNAIQEISKELELTQTRESGYKNCCHSNVYITARSADGKRFEYVVKEDLENTKPSDQNLTLLRNLYGELGKNEIVAHLDKRIAAINANIGGKTILGDSSDLYVLENKENLSFAHPILRKKLKSLDEEVAALANSRAMELDKLNELYGTNLTEETLADKRKTIIQAYDPKIALLAETKYDLMSPLRDVKEIITRLGSKNIRTLSRADYLALNKAMRVSRNYSLDDQVGGNK